MTQMLVMQISGAASQVAMTQNNLLNFNHEMNEIRNRLGMPMKSYIGG